MHFRDRVRSINTILLHKTHVRQPFINYKSGDLLFVTNVIYFRDNDDGVELMIMTNEF